MNFSSRITYADVCVDYAHAYSINELAAAFRGAATRICSRPESQAHIGSKPVIIRHGPDEVEASPTDIKDGLAHFFLGRPTQSWDRTDLPFCEYFKELKADLIKCYVPFRSFSQESFEDAMRLRVYQDSSNIKNGAQAKGATKSYSLVARMAYKLSPPAKPSL
jgi:hypothetical protein